MPRVPLISLPCLRFFCVPAFFGLVALQSLFLFSLFAFPFRRATPFLSLFRSYPFSSYRRPGSARRHRLSTLRPQPALLFFRLIPLSLLFLPASCHLGIQTRLFTVHGRSSISELHVPTMLDALCSTLFLFFFFLPTSLGLCLCNFFPSVRPPLPTSLNPPSQPYVYL